jgi:AraC-like DNA-binding protein
MRIDLRDRPDVVRGSDLEQAARLVGTRFRIRSPGAANDGEALTGQYRLIDLRPGLIVHATDTVELHDLTTEIVQRPGLTCSLVLEGDIDFELGGRHFALSANRKGRPGPCGQFLFREQPELFVRRSRRGMHVRKVNITVTLDYLKTEAPDMLSLLHGLNGTHMAHAYWQPTAHAIALAEQILHPPGLPGFLDRLHLENRVTGLLLEALTGLAEFGSEDAPAIRPRDRRRVEAACDYLDSRLGEHVTLEEVAREVGASVSTLQRLFRAVHGTSVYDYVRERKLLKARFALEVGDASVAAAAHIAGYASPANFATAFKRRFGLSPSELRARQAP